MKTFFTVIKADGLRGASMRAIAKAAGYTPGAIYAYFPSKEHIYAAALGESLDRLRAATHEDASHGRPDERFVAVGLAFVDFYDTNPRDLDLGFYLFRGGIRPHGLSHELNADLNSKFLDALEPLRIAAVDHGTSPKRAARLIADAFAHASGLLLLAHTKRITLFALDWTAHHDLLTANRARPLAIAHIRTNVLPGERRAD